MKGSEKQIEWAENLILAVKNSINKEVEYAKDRSLRKTMPESYGKIYEEEANKIFAKIDTFDDAGQIIDDLKNNLSMQAFVTSFCQIADAKWEEAEINL